jgi:hypothetical protein
MNAEKATSGKPAADQPPSELDEPMWSVVTFDRREASGLTYAEAVAKLKELELARTAGLCIVTDDAAGRITAA